MFYVCLFVGLFECHLLGLCVDVCVSFGRVSYPFFYVAVQLDVQSFMNTCISMYI